MKKFILLVTAFVVCAPLFGQTFLKREFRGMWVATVTNIDWPSSPTAPVDKQKSDLSLLFDKIAASGCNAVIFQVRPECDALYDSPYEPWSYWLTGQQGRAPSPYFDPLAFAVDEAHKRGMELHAWFNPYRAERSVGNYTTAATHVTKAHPDWVLQVGTVKFLNPGLKAVRDYNAKIISDVVRRYDIDAAHMDDYFYVEGITVAQDAAAFAADPRGFTNVADWRRDNVNTLLKQVYDSIQTIKPNVRWGISPRGIWKNGVPSGIVGADNYNTIYCDAVAWMAGKYIDYLAPQLYWKTGGSQDYVKLQSWWSSQMNTRHLYPGLAIYRIGETAYGDASMPSSQIRLNRTTGNTLGAILYTANSMTNNMGGIGDTLRNDLFRYHAIPPSYSWKDNVPPNAPRNVRYAKLPGQPVAQLHWDAPAKAADGDTASKYVLYRLDHATVAQADIDDPRNIAQVTSLSNVAPPGPAATQTVYYAVTALDANNNESAAGAVATVSAPQPIVLAAPASGVVNQAQGVMLSWRSSEFAATYQLQVSSDTSMQFGFVVNDASLTDTVRSVTGLSGQQKYFWRVRGVNVAGNGTFSEIRTFTTGFPSTPLLALPANLNISAPQTGSLAWKKVQSAVSYRVQLSIAADFASMVFDTSGIADTTIAYANLAPSTIHSWRVSAANQTGVSNWSDVFRFKTQAPSAVGEADRVPLAFTLEQNFPNPFNPATTIRFTVSMHQRVQLSVYDVLGRTMATLIDRDMQPGVYTAVWNGADAPSGIYFYRLTSGSFGAVKKMLLQK
jgi:uncharacterized lipoprotein YddW (UPF0748 family)